MDRREILNELQQIVAVTDPNFVGIATRGVPEAARRAKGLIQVIESWPTAFPPAPFVSDQCAERNHTECQLRSANQPITRLYHCACHCPPEAPQQPAEPAFKDQQRAADSRFIAAHAAYIRNQNETTLYELEKAGMAAESVQSRETPAEAPQQPAEPDPLAERHIDTPDELLELLAGVSSDPQIEGLSLSQKASTMALLYTAKALQRVEEMQRTALDYLMKRGTETPIEPLIRRHYSRRRSWRVDHEAADAHDLARQIMERVRQSGSDLEKVVDIALMIRGESPESPISPQEPPTDAPFFDALVGEHTRAWEDWARGMPDIARAFAKVLLTATAQFPTSPQEPS